MAHTTPTVHQGVLDAREGAQAIVVDSPAWFDWLSRHRVFRFASSVGTLTARKERRAAGWYWYAYRRQRGALRSAYLGKSEEVTLARLMRIASVFHGASLQCTASAETAEASEERSLLTTKMTPPMRSSSTIDRPRLLALLRMSDSGKLLLVTGPAGSGKTTLLSTWLREGSRPVAWVSLHEAENDPARFWGYVLAALHMRYPDIAAHTMTLLPTLQDGTMEQFLIPLINALALLPDDLTLVLDDYHVVTNPQVQESVAFLLEHAPARLHLAIASRSLPALPLARLRAQGLLGEVDFDDLRFTREEAAALFQVVTGHAPEPEQLAHLLGSTEGWATGLYLAALAWDGASASALYPSLPHGNHRYIFDYLASEVLARQSTQMRDFLVQTSILDHVYGPLCDAVLLRDDSQRMLEQVARENLFVSPLDDRQGWFRYHQLFAEFLRAHLEQLYPGRAEMLHSRAATWYARNNLLADAIAHALHAGDVALAARFIEEQGRTMLMRHEVLTLGGWLRALPERVVLNHPRLCLFTSWALLHTSHTEPIERYLRAAEDVLGSPDVPDATDARERRGLRGEIAAIRARMAIYQDRTQHSVVLSRQALALLAEDDYYMRGEVALSLATTSLLLDELRAAEEAFREAITLSWACGNLRAALLAVRSLANLYVTQGRLHYARKLYEESLERVSAMGQERLPPVGCLDVGRGELSYEWNDLQAAERYAHEGIALGQRGGDVKIWLLGYVLLMYVSQAQGKPDQVRSLFMEAEHLVRRASFTRGQEILGEVGARLGALQDDSAPLLRWAQESGLDLAGNPDASNEDAYHLLAQALMARDELDAARSLLQRLLERAHQTACHGYALVLSLSLARACESRGDSQNALLALEEALCLAMPQNYCRAFLDQGPRIASLLRTLRQAYQRGMRSPRPGVLAYLDHLLERFRHDLSNTGSPETNTSLAGWLTAREMEVLRLLAAGHSNQEIADTLIISLNSVKTHLRSIYRKLDTHNRTQAILRARSLRVL